MLAREHARLRAARGDRIADRAVLAVVLEVQLVEIRPVAQAGFTRNVRRAAFAIRSMSGTSAAR